MSEIVSARPAEPGAFERWLVISLLLLCLPLAAIGGILISYLLLLLTLLVIACFLVRGRPWPWAMDPMGVVFLGSFVVLASSFAISARGPSDLLYTINFVTFLFYIPLAGLLRRAASPRSASLVSWLAFAGAVLGAGYAVGEIVLTGVVRAGRVQTDPIHLGNATLMLGFLALIGLRQHVGRLRLVLLTGPLFGLVAVIASGTRTAMVAFPVLLLWTILSFIKGWKGRLLTVLALAAALAVVVSLDNLQSARLGTLITTMEQVLSGQAVSDRSFEIRLDLYRAALAAFGEAPLFGYGWDGMMQAIIPYMPEGASYMHLHNEVLNFALASGVFGIAVLAALLVTPIVLALRSPADSQKEARILGCSLILVAYLVMGLADAMISYESRTALYVVWTALLLAYCRDDRQVA